MKESEHCALHAALHADVLYAWRFLFGLPFGMSICSFLEYDEYCCCSRRTRAILAYSLRCGSYPVCVLGYPSSNVGHESGESEGRMVAFHLTVVCQSIATNCAPVGPSVRPYQRPNPNNQDYIEIPGEGCTNAYNK